MGIALYTCIISPLYKYSVCIYVDTKAVSKETIMALQLYWFNMTNEIFGLRSKVADLKTVIEKMDERLEKLE